MSMIQVKLWRNLEDSEVKFYQRTPGDEVLALNDAEAFVGTNPQRRAHIVICGSEYGIYAVRPWDDEKCPEFQDRLKILRTKLDEMERGY